MAQQSDKIKVPRASDRRVVDFFREIAKKYDEPKVRIAALGSVSIGNVDLNDCLLCRQVAQRTRDHVRL
jgi:hypothetical protein